MSTDGNQPSAFSNQAIQNTLTIDQIVAEGFAATVLVDQGTRLLYSPAVDFLGPEAPFLYILVDGSGGIDVGDLTYLVAYLFQGGPAPPPC